MLLGTMVHHDPWSPEYLASLYTQRLRLDETRGIDRMAPSQLADRLAIETDLISRRVAGGDYRFAPYVQVLRSKGATKLPREICVPTARDRIALLALKERLHSEFPNHVGRVLPNSMVRHALEARQGTDPDKHVCLRLDIRDFYGTIEHSALIGIIGARLTASETRLAARAITNPAVPRGSRRYHHPRRRRSVGVPQGLAVSNVLADIYLGDFDQVASSECVSYFRFVDDMMLFVERARAREVYDLIEDKLRACGLSIHPLQPRSAKGGIFGLDERIEFLGYVFDGDQVTVRDTSQDRFLEKIAGRITRYQRERKRLVRDNEWMTPGLVQQVLIDELNERISGAISESRRYGWMFYFSAMTDEMLLFQMDAAIRSMFARLSGPLARRSGELKRLARAFHEVRHRPDGGYIQNYDQYHTMAQRLAFLVERGRVGPDQFVTEEQVNELFDRYRRQQLSELEADVAFLS